MDRPLINSGSRVMLNSKTPAEEKGVHFYVCAGDGLGRRHYVSRLTESASGRAHAAVVVIATAQERLGGITSKKLATDVHLDSKIRKTSN